MKQNQQLYSIQAGVLKTGNRETITIITAILTQYLVTSKLYRFTETRTCLGQLSEDKRHHRARIAATVCS